MRLITLCGWFVVLIAGCSKNTKEFYYTDYNPGPYDINGTMYDTTGRSPFVTDTLLHLERFVADSMFLVADTTGPLAFLTIRQT